MMAGKHSRSIGIHIGRGEVTVLDPVTGKMCHRELGPDATPEELRGALEALYRELEKPANHMQVAFSDDLLLFAAWPLPQVPRKRTELERLARWRLTRITSDLDGWELGYQVVKGVNGAVLLVCAVPRTLMDGVREFVRGNPLRWTVADSSASFIFNAIRQDLKQEAGALLVHSESHWTCLLWDSNGTVEFAKPGRVAGGESAAEIAGEVTRLLHAAAAGGQGRQPSKVMLWGFSEALAELAHGDDQPFSAVRDLFPSMDQAPSRFGHLVAQLASYRR